MTLILRVEYHSSEAATLRRLRPKVWVGVLNRNGREWLLGCLDSVSRTDYPDLEVAVLDNASTDGSQELVRARFPWVRLVAFKQNVGFTSAYNTLLQECTAPYLVLLNNDAVAADPSWLEHLVAAMEEDVTVAAASCKMLYLDRCQQINSVGGKAFWWTGSFDVGDGERDEGQYDSPPLEPFSFCGGAAILRVDAVREVGGFDESMFAYREDFDLSWRLRLKGYRIVYVPKARIYHFGGATWGPLSYDKIYLSSRHWLRAMLKNYSGLTLLRALAGYLFYEFAIRMPGLVWVSRSAHYALVPFHSLLWNVRQAGNTLQARRESQRHRRVSDAVILQVMGPAGFEPLAHIARRARNLQQVHQERSPRRASSSPEL